MSKQKTQKTKKQPEKKKGEVVKLTNGMLDGFLNNPSIAKLRQLPGLGTEVRFKIFRLWELVASSPQMKALIECKNVIITDYNKKQEKVAEEKRTALTLDHPEIQELFKLESGLEVEKPVISNSKLPSDFTSFDMTATGWIIDFEE
jgi:hypothetical protein